MPRESKTARRARAQRLVAKVRAAHPDASCALHFDTPFQLLVATVLSAQNTDDNVNSVTPGLFARYPDAAAMAAAPTDELQRLIHSTGFFRQKAKSLLGLSRALVERHGGEVPPDLDDLVALPGVGRKTANLLLGVCFGVPGLVVDTHVSRLAQRWQLTAHSDAERIERDLATLVPESDWIAFSQATIFHGRRVCSARRPRCEDCALAADCPSANRVAAVAAPRRRASTVVVLLAALAGGFGCQGEGSDIGPRITPLSNADYRVLVRDDQDRPVVSALVTIEGFASDATNAAGRAVIPGTPIGAGKISVVGDHGSATASDALGALTFATLLDGVELPWVVYLPDLAPSAGALINVGTQVATLVLDDSPTSGAILTVAAGTSVGAPGGNSLVLRTGKLDADHLPLDLPAPAIGARAWGRGVLVAPMAVTFSPGAALSVPNDLGLPPNATAELWALEAASGTWVRASSGIVDSGGARIDAAGGAITAGGLYAFATPVAAPTVLSGRILDAAGAPVRGALVRADSAATRTSADGRFSLAAIAAIDGGGTAATARLSVHGGRDLLAVAAALSVPLTPGVIDVGDVVLATASVGIVRWQLINRGRIEPQRRMRCSAGASLTFGQGVGDRGGRIDFDEQTLVGYLGMLTTWPLNRSRVVVTEALRFARAEHHLDLQIFGREDDWWRGPPSGGATQTLVVDADGTGPVARAVVVRGDTPQQGFIANTLENGIAQVAYARGQATAIVQTAANGVTVTSATTLAGVETARIEIPLERAHPAIGVFDAHGLVSGQLVGALGGGRTQLLRATRVLTREEWFDDALLGKSAVGVVPRKPDPALGPGAIGFRIGVPTPAGHLVAVEGTGSGALTLERLGFAAALAPVAGGETQRNLTLDSTADTSFSITDALVGLDPTIAGSEVVYDLALELADGTLLDCVRGAGGLGIAGNDLALTLPGLTGAIAGGRWLVALRGSAAAVGRTVTQQSVAVLDGGAPPRVTFLDAPNILSPTPGQTVAATGFPVQFTVPAGTIYTVVELRAQTATETRTWTAVLPARESSFVFRQLPQEAAPVLVAGLNWTLVVTAARIETGLLAGRADAYFAITQNWVGITAAEREVNALSSVAISVTTQ